MLLGFAVATLFFSLVAGAKNNLTLAKLDLISLSKFTQEEHISYEDIPFITRKASVIVPAYKEQPNLYPLCEKVFAATRKASIDVEIIVVDDDSNDGSIQTVKELKQKGYNISIHVRKGIKGLSTAVLTGFSLAKNQVMLVMDADLQHPPQFVPSLLEPLFNGSATFSLGSRNVAGGGISKDWSMARRMISHTATLLALPLVQVTDPMSGFFAIHNISYQATKNLNPLGFKIALELLVKSENLSVIEIPFTFVSRMQGESKLKLKTQLQYVRHLIALYWYMYRFTIVCSLVVFSLTLLFLYSSIATGKP